MFRCFKLATLAAVVLVGASATNTDAATFTVTPTFVGAFTADGNFTPIPGFDPNVNPTSPVIAQVDFIVNYEGAEGTFGAVVFDIELDNLAPNAAVPDWSPTDASFDANGGAPGGDTPFFATNGDLGLKDLKNVTAGIAPGVTGATDPRLAIGAGGGTSVGTLFLDFGGLGTVTTSLVEGGYNAGGVLSVDTAASLIGGVLTLGASGSVDPVAVGTPTPPGPISLQAAFDDGSGVLAQAIQLSDSADTGTLAISGYEITGPDKDLFGASTNGSNPLMVDLTLDVAAARGLPGGDVNAQLAISTNGGDDLIYNLTASVPEPSSIVLVGLSLVGLVGYARRS